MNDSYVKVKMSKAGLIAGEKVLKKKAIKYVFRHFPLFAWCWIVRIFKK